VEARNLRSLGIARDEARGDGGGRLISPELPSPAEADGAARDEEKDEGDKSQPEPRGSVSVFGDTSEPVHDLMNAGIKCNVNTECHEGQESREEGCQRSQEHHEEVLRKAEPECNEGDSGSNRMNKECPSPRAANGLLIRDIDGVRARSGTAGEPAALLSAPCPYTKAQLRRRNTLDGHG